MTWDYGTITSATPATQLVTKYAAAMEDSGHYDEVDDHTISSTIRYRVFKNTTENFHVIFSHNTAGTGSVTAGLCETYNASNHTAGYLARTSSSYLKSDYGLAPTSVSPFSIDGWALSSNFVIYNAGTTNTTGFTYCISATSKRVVCSTLVGTNYIFPFYAGAFEPFYQSVTGSGTNGWSGSDPGPFCILDANYKGITRLLVPSRVNSFLSVEGYLSNFSSFSGDPGAYNETFDGIVLSRLAMSQRYGSSNTISPIPRGLLYGYVAHSYSPNYAYGDELTVNGIAKYKIIYPGSSGPAVEMI